MTSGQWIASEAQLVQLAGALGAADFGGPLSRGETAQLRAHRSTPRPNIDQIDEAKHLILAGHDPLGAAFCDLRSSDERRGQGAVYTPQALISPMIQWAIDQAPARVIDAGCGSGRFTAAITSKCPEIATVAIDLDPVATLMTRATLASLGGGNTRVIHADYTRWRLPRVPGRTVFVGNPPYVRHHNLTAETKEWAQEAARKLGQSVSGLAGLHAYFFLATALKGRPGDAGCFVTSSEWLDVNYGEIVRQLMLTTLGGEAIHVIEPTALPFEGTATTAAIVNFQVGSTPPAMRFRSIKEPDKLGDLAVEGKPVARARLVETSRWSTFVRTRSQVPAGYIELGELCRVHRGAVTGSNSTWVARADVKLPAAVLYPSITRARELFAAGAVLDGTDHLRSVIDIPADLELFDAAEKKLIQAFLRRAKRAEVHTGYVASHRKAWWSVGLREPAPVLATYMARRPPTFVVNKAQARHINIAHGLYPRQALTPLALERLAQALRGSITLAQGRTYAGGLTKFEPKEMERLPVPDLGTLTSHEPLSPALVR